jgi:hypothetical protein
MYRLYIQLKVCYTKTAQLWHVGMFVFVLSPSFGGWHKWLSKPAKATRPSEARDFDKFAEGPISGSYTTYRAHTANNDIHRGNGGPVTLTVVLAY